MSSFVPGVHQFHPEEHRRADLKPLADSAKPGLDAFDAGLETLAYLPDLVFALLNTRFLPGDIFLQLYWRIVNHPRLIGGRYRPIPLNKRLGVRFRQRNQEPKKGGLLRPSNTGCVSPEAP